MAVVECAQIRVICRAQPLSAMACVRDEDALEGVRTGFEQHAHTLGVARCAGIRQRCAAIESKLAPLPESKRATSSWPAAHTACRGVFPASSVESTRAPRASKNCTVLSWPLPHATHRAVAPAEPAKFLGHGVVRMKALARLFNIHSVVQHVPHRVGVALSSSCM